MPEHQHPRSIEELVALIAKAHGDLVAAFRGLDEATLTRPGPEGWSARGHIAHVTRWERVALVVHLEGGTFAEAAEMDEATARATEHMRAETGLNDWFPTGKTAT